MFSSFASVGIPIALAQVCVSNLLNNRSFKHEKNNAKWFYLN